MLKYFKSIKKEHQKDEKDINSYDNMKLQELKNIAKQLQLKSTGTKKDIIKRIRKHNFFLRFKRKEHPPDKLFQHYSCHGTFCDKNYLMKESYNFIFNNELKVYLSTFSLNGFKYIFNINSKSIVSKVQLKTNHILPLDRNDIFFCRSKNIVVTIPNVLLGDHIKTRSLNQLEEDDDDIFFEYEDIN